MFGAILRVNTSLLLQRRSLHFAAARKKKKESVCEGNILPSRAKVSLPRFLERCLYGGRILRSLLIKSCFELSVFPNAYVDPKIIQKF